ncbi:MAG: AMP-binding protein [Chloroflexi bacterium]|nr:AMP-binding protein [Chloroflexota bacterium]
MDAHTGQQWTYAELDARINQLANFMQRQLGLRQGDRISLLAQTAPTIL